MTTTRTSPAAVLEAVREIVPRLRANGVEAEDRRWIPDENIELLKKAEVFRLAVPERFGGIDASLADQIALVTEISRGCGSTGWVAGAWVQGAWVSTLYPDDVQAEVFRDGEVRVSGGLAPTATMTAVDDGYVLNGSWGFNTGCKGAQWNFVAALLMHPDGTPEPVYALVPMDELTIADDWNVSAAIGTGSFTTSAQDVFVPARRVAGAVQLATGTTGDRENTGATGRNYGLITYVTVVSAAVYLGIAQGALESFLERVQGRGISYTNWTEQSHHPLTQIQVARAANRIAAATALLDGLVELLQQRADAGEHPAVEDSVLVRGRTGFAIQLAKEAVEGLHEVTGASALAREEPFQRFYRDMEGLTRHGMMTPNTNLELQGRFLLGLDPDTLYL